MKTIIKGENSVQKEKSSVRREFKMNADDVIRDAQSMLKVMVEANHGKSVKGALRDVSLQTSIPNNQIKRLYYGEWQNIPAHIFLNLRSSYQKYITKAIKNAEHQQMLFRQELENFDKDFPQCSG